MLIWKIGDVTITCIVETTQIARAHYLFRGATQQSIDAIPWLKPQFLDDKGRIVLSIHCLVVETPSKRIVVDTCMGNDKQRANHGGMLKTDFLDRYEAASFSRDAIDIVLCTHLHYDHVGWNTMLVDGRWVPTFPHARYLIGRTEFDVSRVDEQGDHPAVFADSVRPVFDAGLVDLVATDHRVCDEVRFVPTPGHTLGHVSVEVCSNGEKAFITGDMTHHPSQLAHPDWSNFADHDGAVSAETRRRIFGEIADTAMLVIGSHFMAPTAGHIVRDGDAFRFEA
jgi:glyoxylase-like metal-dependent hydrolase (beta-lactamase superfamily II)